MSSSRSPNSAFIWRPPVHENSPKLPYPIPVYNRGSSAASTDSTLSTHEDARSSQDDFYSGWQTTRTSTRPSSVTDSEPASDLEQRKRHLSPMRVQSPRSQLHQEVQRDEEAAPVEEQRKIVTIPLRHPSHGLRHPLASHPQRPSIESRASSRQNVATTAAVAQPSSKEGFQEFASMCNQSLPKTRPAVSPEFSKLARRMITQQKLLMTAGMVSANFILIFASWFWPSYYYLYLPFITLTVALNCIMVFSCIFFSIKHRIFPEKVVLPPTPESLVLLLPCYNENFDECTKSLDSLVAQKHLEQHKRAIMIICDGRVRGAGMEKTTAQYLLDDILAEKTERKVVKEAYTAWDQQPMDVTIQKGSYKGTPYFCIIKHQNQGKRDGLIALRSFLYKFNTRAEKPQMLFRPAFFAEMALFLSDDAGIDHVSHLVGMDADTVFEDDCISELLKQSHFPGTVGVCGYVAVDFKNRNWNIWSLYQSSEYTISQGLRRLHQSIVTNKVSCLPGCCQLLKICEETCGDHVLVELFGYCPTPADNILKQIRATASEDRNHVCLMLSARPQSRTRQALRARALTDVPQSWSVFLSQRRRWTLGATGNDLFLFKAPGVHWWERILAFSNCMTWALNVFIFASLASLIHACLFVPWFIIIAFASVMLIPLSYYLAIAIWLPRTAMERTQYLAGCACYVLCGPFINIAVLLYAVWNMDSFGWGKTRKVISEDTTTSPDPISVPTDIETPAATRVAQPASLHPDIVAILDDEDGDLAETFASAYRTLLFGKPRKFDPTLPIETTTDPSRLRLADLFLLTTTPSFQTRLSTVLDHARRGSVLVVMEDTQGALGDAEVEELVARCEGAGVVVGLARRAAPFEVVVAGGEEEGVGERVRGLYERVAGGRVKVEVVKAAKPQVVAEKEGTARGEKKKGVLKRPAKVGVEEVGREVVRPMPAV